ncbi:nuclear transport factor 2 family protein [Maribacter sp. 2307ULW6-5]|uniref:nuclear transport factor 2 family protein n=1 Tax=Maribacter sp. 2307ULW6-5 TaxID=3386275 RepID=UPI0039BC874B
MKHHLFFLGLLSLFPFPVLGQQETEVFLVEMGWEEKGPVFGIPINLSKNHGYDNQPSFDGPDHLLYAATRNGQTDVVRQHLVDHTKQWLTQSPQGSEYSPTKMPVGPGFSTIRLDTSGLQRLYVHETKDAPGRMLPKDAKIGYHLWYSANELVATVLVQNRMDLFLFDVERNSRKQLHQNVGRSLHRLPHSEMISFIALNNKEKTLFSLHPISGRKEAIAPLPKGTEDVCWLPNGNVLTGVKNTILQWDPKTSRDWAPLHSFSQDHVNDISRMAVGPEAKRMAFVSSLTPPQLIDKQMAAFSKKELDVFSQCFSKEVLVTRFWADTLHTGRDAVKAHYRNFFAEHDPVGASAGNRIRLGNTVIDHETVIKGDQTKVQAVIYQVQDATIDRMDFVALTPNEGTDAEKVVQEQLEAYNQRDLDAFVATYAEDISIYNYGGNLLYKGHDALRAGYARFFESAPDLHCQIQNRIVLGNKVIDLEHVTARGSQFQAIAIYEVNGGKITKVTFIR